MTLNDVSVEFAKNSGLFDLFSEREVVKAVDGVSIEIPENQVVVLVGESGCGKTTLGKTTIGLQEPTAGSVEYRGHDIWAAKKGKGEMPYREIRRSLQIIHQDPGSSLNPNRTVMASLMEPLRRWYPELDTQDKRARILSMIERVGMSPAQDYADRYPHQLSGGEKQRVALVRALIMNPELILADEAISALDVSLRVEMMNLMIELQDLIGTSYLMISHDLSNARYMAKKTGGYIGIMYLGEIVEFGPASEVIEDPSHPYTKALKWATPELSTFSESGERMPIRSIDIPDAVNPPSGCRFHTRCPKAREVCTQEHPELAVDPADDLYQAACFRDYEDHPYWESSDITDGGEEPMSKI
ncbi:oligopeptide/dipeptide ABC transporter ATP-binding protein [Halococcus hamelinensis]|uniref:Oligopeptide/dipeptide ABC transporter, ATPase subunit n=1 Tax=Halococcus hamelinensis 100A6 TaxID=1132509 RepID=M0LUQ7_9EURY|nr:ABC transporter ATP-binding protein [Halococcus hamelinensis]EMA37186.1 oligopeptide/dipeptide ABC transporter, ATPase subunit [Halococcus hamelinensis 100A6]